LNQWSAYRDIILFCGGLIGVAHEMLLADVERPWLLAVFAAMMGLPAFLQLDRKRGD
jgi:hypothetical protein